MNSFWSGVNPESVQKAEEGFKEFKVGDNIATISRLEEKVSESGNPMLQITFENDEGAEIRYYIVEGEYKLSRIKQVQLAFGITMGSIYAKDWIGKKGIVVCKPGEPYKGKVYNKVSYFRPLAEEQKKLQPENKPSYKKPVEISYDDIGFTDDGFTDDIPF